MEEVDAGPVASMVVVTPNPSARRALLFPLLFLELPLGVLWCPFVVGEAGLSFSSGLGSLGFGWGLRR